MVMPILVLFLISPEGRKYRNTSAIIMQAAIVAYACANVIFPLAIGRILFFGCNLSAFASFMSLKQYMELAAIENAINVHRALASSSKERIFWLKNIGRNMNVFFNHCAGRSNFIILFIKF